MKNNLAINLFQMNFSQITHLNFTLNLPRHTTSLTVVMPVCNGTFCAMDRAAEVSSGPSSFWIHFRKYVRQ